MADNGTSIADGGGVEKRPALLLAIRWLYTAIFNIK
jgi:hypothetical protein